MSSSTNYESPVNPDNTAATVPTAPIKKNKPTSKARGRLPLLPTPAGGRLPLLPAPTDCSDWSPTEPALDQDLLQATVQSEASSPTRRTARSRNRNTSSNNPKRASAPAPSKKRKPDAAPPAPEGFEVENLEETVTEEEEEAAPKTPPKKKICVSSSSRATSMVAHTVPVHPEDAHFVGVGYGKLGNYCTAVSVDQIFSEQFQTIIEEYSAKGAQTQLIYTCLDTKEKPTPGVELKRKLVQFIVSGVTAYSELRCLKLIKGDEFKWIVTPATVEKKKLRFYVSRVIAQKLLA